MRRPVRQAPLVDRCGAMKPRTRTTCPRQRTHVVLFTCTTCSTTRQGMCCAGHAEKVETGQLRGRCTVCGQQSTAAASFALVGLS